MNTFTRSLLTMSAAAALSLSVAPAVSAAWWPLSPMMAMHYNKGVVSWNSQSDAKWYNIYYREMGDKKYMHAVRRLPGTSRSFPLMYLKRNARYVYNIAAVNAEGREYWWSGEKPLMTSFMQ